MPEKYRVSVSLPTSVEESFAYHERPGALQRLVPPWESVRLEHSDQSLAVGSRVVLVNSIFGIPVRWVAEHTDYQPPHLFADTQVSGPFAQWDHRHQFASGQTESSDSNPSPSDSNASPSDATSVLTDDITYRVPAGPIGNALGGPLARKTIERMFAYRHHITQHDLMLGNRYALSPQTIAISGSSGLVGQSLSALMTLLGHRVAKIVRSPSDNASDIAVWSDAAESQKFQSVDTVVHLAGKSIASARWNENIKKQIRDSRVEKTRQLCQRLADLPQKPKTLVCASAIGIYGNRGDETLTESSPPGDDFLADVAMQWEDACQPAIDAGIRVVNARFGIVLSPTDGALKKMLTPAKLFGGKLGSGKQWWSWIGLDDVVGGIYHCIAKDQISGPVNFVAPTPLRNETFAKELGIALSRPALFPAPAFALRAALGEMADALLLSSNRVLPTVLEQSGYQFRFNDLQPMLRYALGCNRLKSQD